MRAALSSDGSFDVPALLPEVYCLNAEVAAQGAGFKLLSEAAVVTINGHHAAALATGSVGLIWGLVTGHPPEYTVATSNYGRFNAKDVPQSCGGGCNRALRLRTK